MGDDISVISKVSKIANVTLDQDKVISNSLNKIYYKTSPGRAGAF